MTEYSMGDKVEFKGKPAEIVDILGYTRNIGDIKYKIKLESGKTKKIRGSKLKPLETAE